MCVATEDVPELGIRRGLYGGPPDKVTLEPPVTFDAETHVPSPNELRHFIEEDEDAIRKTYDVLGVNPPEIYRE